MSAKHSSSLPKTTIVIFSYVYEAFLPRTEGQKQPICVGEMPSIASGPRLRPSKYAGEIRRRAKVPPPHRRSHVRGRNLGELNRHQPWRRKVRARLLTSAKPRQRQDSDVIVLAKLHRR